MTFEFKGLKVSDDNREKADIYLISTQNRKYLNKLPTISPTQLIKKFGLETIKVVGVTGTNGKTTTSAIIYSLLNDLGYKTALQGTRGFFIQDRKVEGKGLTTPPLLKTLYHLFQAKKEGVSHFVMEVSSHAIAQKRIEGLEFALKVLTNISQDHLDYHKTMEEYIKVKSSFFLDDSLKLINKEEKKITFNPKNARTYAIEEIATYQAIAYSLSDGISALVRFGSESVDIHSPLQGLFNLYNLLAGFGAVHTLTNEPLEKIAQVVPNFAGVEGRMEVISQKPLIIVDFAHTPDGMKKVFESFGGRKVKAIFGAGGDRDKDKRPKMGEVASRYCTKIYLTSDNPRSEEPTTIIEEIAKGIKNKVALEKIPSRKEAIKKALQELKEDEVLLVLGKGDEEFIEVGNRKIPFKDKEVILNLLDSVRK